MENSEIARKCMIFQWIGHSRCPQKFKDLMAHINDKYMTIESLSTDYVYHKNKTADFIDTIEQIYTYNNKKRFSNHMFK